VGPVFTETRNIFLEVLGLCLQVVVYRLQPSSPVRYDGGYNKFTIERKFVVVITLLFLFKAAMVIVFFCYVMCQCFGEPGRVLGFTGMAIGNRLIHGVLNGSSEGSNSFINRGRIIQTCPIAHSERIVDQSIIASGEISVARSTSGVLRKVLEIGVIIKGG
jgi:hypothetical protein